MTSRGFGSWPYLLHVSGHTELGEGENSENDVLIGIPIAAQDIHWIKGSKISGSQRMAQSELRSSPVVPA